jgi:hypothetical protein
MRCMAQRGFLTLRGCDHPGTATCSSCRRTFCNEHLSPLTGFTECLDCAARKSQNAALPDDYGRDWLFRYRTSYYSSSYYDPIMWDDDDAAGFNTAGVDDDDRSGGPGFQDS